MTTAALLAEVRELSAKATPGPWTVEPCATHTESDYYNEEWLVLKPDGEDFSVIDSAADAAFIARAREMLELHDGVMARRYGYDRDIYKAAARKLVGEEPS